MINEKMNFAIKKNKIIMRYAMNSYHQKIPDSSL